MGSPTNNTEPLECTNLYYMSFDFSILGRPGVSAGGRVTGEASMQFEKPASCMSTSRAGPSVRREMIAFGTILIQLHDNHPIYQSLAVPPYDKLIDS